MIINNSKKLMIAHSGKRLMIINYRKNLMVLCYHNDFIIVFQAKLYTGYVAATNKSLDLSAVQYNYLFDYILLDPSW